MTGSCAPSCYMYILDKLQKLVCKTVGHSIAASFEALAHCQSLASISLFYRYYFGRFLSELGELIPFSHSCARSLHYSNSLLGFSASISKCSKDVPCQEFSVCRTL